MDLLAIEEFSLVRPSRVIISVLSWHLASAVKGGAFQTRGKLRENCVRQCSHRRFINREWITKSCDPVILLVLISLLRGVSYSPYRFKVAPQSCRTHVDKYAIAI